MFTYANSQNVQKENYLFMSTETHYKHNQDIYTKKAIYQYQYCAQS